MIKEGLPTSVVVRYHMEELIFCQIERVWAVGAWLVLWCQIRVSRGGDDVGIAQILHRKCKWPPRWPLLLHNFPYFELLCSARNSLYIVHRELWVESERDRFLHKDHIIIIIIWPMVEVLKEVTLFNLNVFVISSSNHKFSTQPLLFFGHKKTQRESTESINYIIWIHL